MKGVFRYLHSICPIDISISISMDMPTNYNHTLYVGSCIDSLDKYLDRRKLQIISNKLKAAWNKM